MARTMSTALKAAIDSSIGTGGCVKIINAINSGHTALDPTVRAVLSKVVDGLGEATAFETALTSNSTLSVAAMNRIEKEFRGRGNAEEFQLCVSDGTIT